MQTRLLNYMTFSTFRGYLSRARIKAKPTIKARNDKKENLEGALLEHKMHMIMYARETIGQQIKFYFYLFKESSVQRAHGPRTRLNHSIKLHLYTSHKCAIARLFAPKIALLGSVQYHTL